MPATQTKTYTHTQTVASTTWTINHGMGYRPSVQTVVEVDGQNVVMLPKSITHASDNQVVVEFSIARTGTARLM